MARFFCPAVICPVCFYANDLSFRSCQSCCYIRKARAPRASNSPDFVLKSLDERIAHLQQVDSTSPYAKQKRSLADEFEIGPSRKQMSVECHPFRRVPFPGFQRPERQNQSPPKRVPSHGFEGCRSVSMSVTFNLRYSRLVHRQTACYI